MIQLQALRLEFFNEAVTCKTNTPRTVESTIKEIVKNTPIWWTLVMKLINCDTLSAYTILLTPRVLG